MPMVPIDNVLVHPRRVRQSAQADLIASLERFDQYKPLTVSSRTNFILKGMGVYLALKDLGRSEVDVVFIDVDSETETKIILVDEATSAAGTYDYDLLTDALVAVDLAGTGYTEKDVSEMTAMGYDAPALPDTEADEEVDFDSPTPAPVSTPQPTSDDGDAGDDDDDWEDPPRPDPTVDVFFAGSKLRYPVDHYNEWLTEMLDTHGDLDAVSAHLRAELGLQTPSEIALAAKASRPDHETPLHQLDADWVDATTLELFPGNAKIGDVGRIADSLKEHGQYSPIICNADRTIIAGNHTFLGATKGLGWTHLWVRWVNVDEATAKAMNAADNRLHDLGTASLTRTADLLVDLGGNITGTGYSNTEAAELLGAAWATNASPDAYASFQVGAVHIRHLSADEYTLWSNVQPMRDQADMEKGCAMTVGLAPPLLVNPAHDPLPQ